MSYLCDFFYRSLIFCILKSEFVFFVDRLFCLCLTYIVNMNMLSTLNKSYLFIKTLSKFFSVDVWVESCLFLLFVASNKWRNVRFYLIFYSRVWIRRWVPEPKIIFALFRFTLRVKTQKKPVTRLTFTGNTWMHHSSGLFRSVWLIFCLIKKQTWSTCVLLIIEKCQSSHFCIE